MNKRVLLIDDEPTVLHAATLYLRRAGFSVDCARELEEAEALIAHVHYDIVIADLSLSGPNGMEGLELVRYIRLVSRTTKVALLTGYASHFAETEAMRRGCDAFVGKPTPLHELALIAAQLTGAVH
jgi:DNA-binding response OmpR family regulator